MKPRHSIYLLFCSRVKYVQLIFCLGCTMTIVRSIRKFSFEIDAKVLCEMLKWRMILMVHNVKRGRNVLEKV